jgi:hypothetical protein
VQEPRRSAEVRPGKALEGIGEVDETTSRSQIEHAQRSGHRQSALPR